MKKHKYFRRKDYLNKLENKFNYHTYYITKEPDPRRRREHESLDYYYIARGLEFDKPQIGRNYYIYYKKPEVKYSIQRWHTNSSYSRLKKSWKKSSNRRVRYSKDYINHGGYRRLNDYWDID